MQENSEEHTEKNNLALKRSQTVDTIVLCGCSKILVFSSVGVKQSSH